MHASIMRGDMLGAANVDEKGLTAWTSTKEDETCAYLNDVTQR